VGAIPGLVAAAQLFGVTQTSTGAMNFPGAGFPTWTRSAVTSSPVSRLNEAQGLGIRPKVMVWIGRPVAEFMMVALMLMLCRYPLQQHRVHPDVCKFVGWVANKAPHFTAPLVMS